MHAAAHGGGPGAFLLRFRRVGYFRQEQRTRVSSSIFQNDNGIERARFIGVVFVRERESSRDTQSQLRGKFFRFFLFYYYWLGNTLLNNA